MSEANPGLCTIWNRLFQGAFAWKYAKGGRWPASLDLWWERLDNKQVEVLSAVVVCSGRDNKEHVSWQYIEYQTHWRDYPVRKKGCGMPRLLHWSSCLSWSQKYFPAFSCSEKCCSLCRLLKKLAAPFILLCLNFCLPAFVHVKDAYKPLPTRKPIPGSFYRSRNCYLPCAWWCHWMQGLPQAGHHPSHRHQPGRVQRYSPCCSLPLPFSCAGKGSCCEAQGTALRCVKLYQPWKLRSCLRGAADLHRNPSNQITAVASVLFPHHCTKGHWARIT